MCDSEELTSTSWSLPVFFRHESARGKRFGRNTTAGQILENFDKPTTTESGCLGQDTRLHSARLAIGRILPFCGQCSQVAEARRTPLANRCSRAWMSITRARVLLSAQFRHHGVSSNLGDIHCLNSVTHRHELLKRSRKDVVFPKRETIGGSYEWH